DATLHDALRRAVVVDEPAWTDQPLRYLEAGRRLRTRRRRSVTVLVGVAVAAVALASGTLAQVHRATQRPEPGAGPATVLAEGPYWYIAQQVSEHRSGVRFIEVYETTWAEVKGGIVPGDQPPTAHLSPTQPVIAVLV